MKKITCLAVAVVLGFAISAQAGVTNVAVVQVDNSAGGAELDGFVTNDILIDFEGQYTGSQLFLDSGQPQGIYQNGINAGKGAPSVGLAIAIPAVGFDTFIAQGTPTSDGPAGNPSAGGGAVDLGQDAAAVFDTSIINQAWNPAGGQTGTTDQSNFLIARVTLRNDVTTPTFLLASAGGQRIQLEGTVTNGQISFIPEPSSILLGTFGILSIFSLRRRS